jgi:4-hydroxy-tetrahydrodipicolinate synthase
VAACAAGDYRRALPLHERLLPLVKALFLETSPGPVKAALEMLGICGGELRLPMVTVSAPTAQRLRAELLAFGLHPQGARP